MKTIKTFINSKDFVWSQAKEFLRSQAILVQEGKSCSQMELIPNVYEREFWVHAIHTGATAQFLIAVADTSKNQAYGLILEGYNWCIEAIIQQATVAVNKVFSKYSYREKRRVIMEIAKVSYNTLTLLNEQSVIEQENNNFVSIQ